MNRKIEQLILLMQQIEEEDSVSKIISKLKAFGQENSALFLIDKELGKREYTSPKY